MPEETDGPTGVNERMAFHEATDEPMDEGFPPEAVPTLREAFFTLCAAMTASLEENVPAADHCREIQAWMTNAGSETDENAVQAWRHAVQLLEGMLGQSLTQR